MFFSCSIHSSTVFIISSTLIEMPKVKAAFHIRILRKCFCFLLFLCFIHCVVFHSIEIGYKTLFQFSLSFLFPFLFCRCQSVSIRGGYSIIQFSFWTGLDHLQGFSLKRGLPQKPKILNICHLSPSYR